MSSLEEFRPTVREVKVDNSAYRRDVQATCSNICCNEDRCVALRKQSCMVTGFEEWQ